MIVRPFDAWVIRRVLSGQPLNGNRERLNDSCRPLVDRLDSLPLEARQNAWGGFLDGQDHATSIITALADTDPTGPAPESEADDPAEQWPPLRFGGLPPVEPFPIDVFPEPVARLIVDGAKAIGCPEDFLAIPVPALAGGTIGRSVSLRLKDDYFASATIFAAEIGPPSDGKTPALKAVSRAVRRIDASLEVEHSQAVERWQEESNRPGPDSKKPKPTPPPKPRRIDVDDITMEALPLILADNPRGLVMIRDELTAFLLGMNQYKGGKGNDRAVALKIWSGDAIKKDRVGHEANMPIRCAYPCLSIVGGMPPDMLGSLLDSKGRADGFIDRFLLTYPDPVPISQWSERGIPSETSDDWCEVIARLWLRTMNAKTGRPSPMSRISHPRAKMSGPAITTLTRMR